MAAPLSTSPISLSTRTTLATREREIELALERARPRLLRIARLAGVAPGLCDDVAQETLLVAWRTRTQLRDPHRLNAWLDGICRNLCLHYHRTAARERRRLVCLQPYDPAGEHPVEALELPAVDEPDPLAEVERADQEHLLDRALGFLPEPAREALELSYLAELPLREAAQRLQLSVSALEARLHRARRHLRRVLETDLRDEAESFGWFPDGMPAEDWRESRRWCYFCGKRRLVGSFRPLPNGNLELRMRCPVCCQQCESFINASDALQLRRAHSFGPSLKRLLQFGHQHFILPLQSGTSQRCFGCGQPVRVLVRHYAEPLFDSAPYLRSHYAVMYTCATCGILADSSAAVALLPHPTVATFITQHPRYRIEPEHELEYRARRAIHFRFADGASTARLNIFADRTSLQVLDTLLE